MIERDLYPAVMLGLQKDGCLAFRIGDSPFGKKPFDIAAIAPGGKIVAVEVKIMESEVTEDRVRKALRPHQLEWLESVAKQGGSSFAIAYSKSKREMIAFHIGETWQRHVLESVRVGTKRAFTGWPL